MREFKRTKNYALLGVAIIASTLSGCSSVNNLLNNDDAIDYKSAVSGEPLSLPPDLSGSQIRPVYVAPAGVASALGYSEAVARARKANASGQVLPDIPGMKVMASGNARWLSIDADPNVIYPKLIAFWTSEGFTISKDNPRAGQIQTDWAENRANIPGSFLQRVLGSLYDAVADSGERDRFTTRLERVNGKTEVYISHERMVETQMDKDRTSFKWLPAQENPELNAAMLTRMMVFLGESKSQAKEMVKSASSEKSVQNHRISQLSADGSQLVVKADALNSWRMVGQALSSAGFTIDKASATAGTYVVRYLDTDNGEERKEGNFFTRLFGSDGNVTPLPYTIQVSGKGKESVVTVQGPSGQQDSSGTVRRILTVIMQKM